MSTDNSQFYGLNKGGAQVLQGNPGLQSLQRQIALEQKRRNQEDAAAQAQLSKIDYNKTREADQEYFVKGYQTIQNTYAQLRNTTDPIQRMRLNNQLQGQQRDFMHSVSLSQQAMENEKSLRDFGREHANDLKDDYGQQLANATKVSIFDPGYQKNLEYFNDAHVPKFDIDKLGQTIDSKYFTPSEGKPVLQNINGFQVLTKPVSKTLNEKAAHDYLITQAHGNKQLQKYLVANYGENGNITEDGYNKFANDIIEPLRAKNETKNVNIASQAPERPLRLSALEEYNLAHFGDPNSPNKGNATNALTPAQALVIGNPNAPGTGLKDNHPVAVQKYLAELPHKNYDNGATPSLTVDPKTGEHVLKIPAITSDKQRKANDLAKKNYEDDPEYKNKRFGLFGGTKVPFDQSDKKKDLISRGLYKEGKGKEYRANPNDPGYLSKMIQAGAENGANWSRFNQAEGIKGGHGQVAPAQIKGTSPVNKHKKAASDYGL